MSRKLIFVNVFALLAVFAIDQLTKCLILTSPQPVWGGDVLFFHLGLALSHNDRFAFSVPGPTWLVFALSLVVFAVIGYAWARLLAHKPQQALWLAVILGGGLGNLLDRARLGSVVDFIEVRLGTLTWSSFNLADAAVVIGAFGWVWWQQREKNYAKTTVDGQKPA